MLSFLCIPLSVISDMGHVKPGDKMWLGKLLGAWGFYFINYCFILHASVPFTCSFFFFSFFFFPHRKWLQALKTNSVFLFYVMPKRNVAWAAACSPNTGGESEVAHQRGLGEAVLHTCYTGLITNHSVFSGCIYYLSARLPKSQVKLLQVGWSQTSGRSGGFG